MPPKKGVKRATTPPSGSAPKRSSKKSKMGDQPSLEAFFTSPTKPKKLGLNGNSLTHQHGKSAPSVISIEDSDDEMPVEHVPNGHAPRDADERLARDLARQWEAEDSTRASPTRDKGKQRSTSRSAASDEEDVVLVKEVPLSERREGVNGSSSKKTRLPPLPSLTPKKESSPVKDVKPVHPLFQKTTEASPPLVKVESAPSAKVEQITPGKSKGITTASAEPVDPIDFDQDQFLFRPGAVDTSKWPKGRLPYSILVGVYVQVSSTRSRLLIVRILTNFLHLVLHASPQDLPPSLYLLSNHLLPSYLPSELGVGSQILTSAVRDVSGLQPRDLRKLWEKWGDPGDVAYEAKSNLRTLVQPAPLLVYDVYNRLLGITRIKGTQSGKIKGDVVRKLMVQARGEEVRFLVRSLVGNLRIGAVRLTLLTSLARATALFNMDKALLGSVRAIPPTPAKEKGKRVPKPKAEPDSAREEVERRCLEAIKLVRKVYVRHPNYRDLVIGLENGGLDGLEERVAVSVGIPLSPMLGSITRSLNEVFTRLGSLPFTAEAKLDGQRVQIHARRSGPQGEPDGGGRWVQSDSGDKIWVRLFSRHLEDMTEKYPDVCHLLLTLFSRPLPSRPRLAFPSTASDPTSTVLSLLDTPGVDSVVLDAEIVAVDKDTGAYRTFQELSNRAKKDVRVEDVKVVVGVFAFDLMLLNDTPLLDSPFSHRRHLLRTIFPPFADPSDPLLARFAHVDSLDSTGLTDAPAEIQAFFQQVVEQKCEGLMVKLLESGEGIVGEDAEPDDDEVDDKANKGKKGAGSGGKKKPLPATYEPDQRSQGWLKVKKDYLEGLGDSLDLVPIGAWWGQGRKAGWWSPILLACHNPETGALEAVCKCISGFTDQFYKDLLVRYPPEGLPEKCSKTTPLGYYETNGLRPDVWFCPSEVWEIRGADITLSPVYPAAASLLGSERGLSMRFPRFMRLRDDKSWEQASTSEQFAEMYRKQIREAPARIKVEEGDEPLPTGDPVDEGERSDGESDEKGDVEVDEE